MALSLGKRLKGKTKKNTDTSASANSTYMEVLKALAVSLLLTLTLALIMSLIIMLAGIPATAVSIISQVIKGVSLFLGAMYGFKTKANGWKKGLLLGILYGIAAYVVFSLMDGGFSWGIFILVDIATAAAMGVICGIIVVNTRK